MFFIPEALGSVAKTNRGKKMNIRIYIFEDSDQVRLWLEEILGMHGYKVQTFSHPSPGIIREMNTRKSPGQTDIVITDMDMPEMCGSELTQKLIAAGFDEKNIAVISGYWTEESAAEAARVKMFRKPFSIRELLVWVEERKCGRENPCLPVDQIEKI
jgi:DNA-binding NtrC family response regulator